MKILNQSENSVVFERAAEMIGKMQIFGGTRYIDKILSHHSFSIASYEKDEQIFSRKKFKRAISLILFGKATVKKEFVDSEILVRTLEAGDMFGVAALFGEDDTYVSHIVAEEECAVAFLPQEILEAVFTVCPDAAIAYIKTLSQKIRYLNKKIENYSAPSALAKLSIYLLQNPVLSVSMQEIADRLGVTRMTLYRNLNILIQNRCVRKEGKLIEVIDTEMLLHFAIPGEII